MAAFVVRARSSAFALVVAALAILPAASAKGAEDRCPAPPEGAPELASIDPEVRLAWVDAALRRASERAQTWGWAWRATFQTAAVAQLGLASAVQSRATRIDLLAGSFKSTTGFLFAMVFPLPAERHHDPLAPEREDPRPLCARLAEAEATLVRDAAGERRARSLGMHALGLGFNAAVTVVVGLMHGRWWTAVGGAISGGIVGEARVFTTPTVATEALDRYRSANLGAPRAKASIAPVLAPTRDGVELGVTIVF